MYTALSPIPLVLEALKDRGYVLETDWFPVRA
jgi:hypothetical protein